MQQSTLSVALEVKPESYEHLSELLNKLYNRRGDNQQGVTGEFAPFLATVPVLHFMSLSLFPGYEYDPLFVIEANFDGEPGPFWHNWKPLSVLSYAAFWPVVNAPGIVSAPYLIQSPHLIHACL